MIEETVGNNLMKIRTLETKNKNMMALLFSYLCDPPRYNADESIKLLEIVHRILSEDEPLVTIPEQTERVSFSIDMPEGALIKIQVFNEHEQLWKTVSSEDFNILMKGKIFPEFKTRFLTESKTGKGLLAARTNVTKESSDGR